MATTTQILGGPEPFGSGPAGLLRTISKQEFAMFQGLVYREAGIFLSPAKQPLLVARLTRRLRDLHLDSFSAYYNRVLKDPAEQVRMFDCITTNETQFFREPRQFEFLDEQVLPAWGAAAEEGRRQRKIRVWSAGCSTGQEPYSLAMTLLRRFPPSSGWSIEILATDLSTRALEKARRAEWPVKKAGEIPACYLKPFMLKGTGENEGRMKAGPVIRSLVSFRRLNLNDEIGTVGGVFDLVFCRNVLIYFDAESRRRVLDGLVRHLAPEGFLFLGHAESLTGVSNRLQSVATNVYAWPSEVLATPGGSRAFLRRAASEALALEPQAEAV